MQPKAMDFIAYTVSDLDRAIVFYRDHLGLPLAGHWPEVPWAEFDVRTVTLALSVYGEKPDPAQNKGGGVIALAVDDVEATLEELRAKGVTVLQQTQDTGVCHMALIADPDGNRVWLHRRHDGTSG